jgi:tetratricopeptide (TPR) repeat protein
MKTVRPALSLLLLSALTFTPPVHAQTPKPASAGSEASRLVSSARSLLETAINSQGSSTPAVNAQNFKRALDEATRAITADPASAAACLIRARIYSTMPAAETSKPANRELALKDCDKAILLKPGYGSAWYWRGAIRLQIASSVSDTNAMMEGFLSGAGAKKDVKVTDSRGSTVPQILDLALADMGKAVSLEPTAAHFLGRGNAYQAKGNLDSARKDYEQALKLDPALPAAKTALAALPSGASLIAGDWDFTNTLGTSPIKFRLQFTGTTGALAGSVIAANGNKTPLQNVTVKPDRSVSFKLVTGNGATLDCTGAFAEDYKKMSGQSTVTFNGQSGRGQFSAEKRL